MLRPFETSSQQLTSHLDELVSAVYDDLESSSLIMPKGTAFVEYARFREAYEEVKRATEGFRSFTPETVWSALVADSLTLVVVRTILGLTPPDWATLAKVELGENIPQTAARDIDTRARTDRGFVARLDARRSAVTVARLRALVHVACTYISAGAPPAAVDTVHQLQKFDTEDGLTSLRRAADLHVPYAVLLYERFLGLPFASHKNSISGLVGDAMEDAIEARLIQAGVSFRKTRRAERIPGFDQAPDFAIPDEVAPRIVIEAKIANDDGTARDKFTRIIHLAELSRERVARGEPGFEVIACIDGRGFGVRREDMRRLISTIGGKVFTLRTLDQMIAHTRLAAFVTAHQEPEV